MSEPVSEFTISIDQVKDYQFQVNFDGTEIPAITLDEPPPLGESQGPSPARTLAAAVGGCLSMSLLFCLTKSRIDVQDIKTKVKVQIVRNEKKRLRVGKAEVTITPEFGDEGREKAGRCLALFEDFCTVTAAVREGFDIDVRVDGIEA
jgi:uncharacterized OsmC-like protein